MELQQGLIFVNTYWGWDLSFLLNLLGCSDLILFAKVSFQSPIFFLSCMSVSLMKGWKCLLHNKSQLSQGREILRHYVKRSTPICLSTAHWKVRDSSKRFELMLFFSGGKNKEREEWEITERKKWPRDLPGFEPGTFRLPGECSSDWATSHGPWWMEFESDLVNRYFHRR